MARDKNQTWEIGLCGGHSGPATQIIGPFKTSRAAHDAIKYLNDNRAEAKTKFSQRSDQWRVAYSGEITRATICGERKPPVRLYPTSLARVACYVREAILAEPTIASSFNELRRVLRAKVDEDLGEGTYDQIEACEIDWLAEYYVDDSEA